MSEPGVEFTNPSAVQGGSMLDAGKWLVRNDVYWVDFMFKGKRYRKSTGFKSEKLATPVANKMIHDIVNGIEPHTVSEAIDLFLKQNADKKDHAGDVNKAKVFRVAMGDVDLRDVTMELVDKVIDTLHTNATKNRYLSFIQSVLKIAKKYKWTNEVWVFEKYKENNQVEGYLATEDVQKIVDVLQYPYNQALIFAHSTGRRRANVFGLKWSDVDLEQKVAIAEASSTKANKALRTPLLPDAIAAIEAMQGFDPVYVFGNKPIHRKAWLSALKKAGLSTEIRWHDLRHTCATNLVKAGVNLLVVQQIMGWQSPKMMERYVHLSPNMLAEAVTPMAQQTQLTA